jgi:hypothetical protein
MDRRLAPTALTVAAIVLNSTSQASPAVSRVAALTHPPVVMRLNKDEFRIAFGVGAPGCTHSGCSGVIRYRVDWKTEDGAVISEFKRVGYSVLPNSDRTITVDRAYFDTAEGAHTTAIVRVVVDRITCTHGADAIPAQVASLRP